MQITRFSGANIHGYLNFQIKFFNDLTFLIGINGSGKTTAVRTIYALLAPNLSTLAHTQYDEIRVELIHNDEKITVSSWQDKSALKIDTSKTEKVLAIPKFEMPIFR